MAYSIKLVQKYLRSKPPQVAPIYIRVIYNRQFFHGLVKKSIKVNDWDDGNERVKKSHPSVTSLNNYLHKRKMDVEKIMMELDTKYKLIPKSLIIDAVKRKENPTDFMLYFNNHLRTLEKTDRIGTYKKDRVVYHKLNEWLGKSKLNFHDINQKFLAAFEEYLRNKFGNCQSTIHNNMKVLRKLYNQAINEGIMVNDQNLFRKYKLKRGRKKEIVFLSDEELERLWQLDLSDKPKDKLHRDMFVFACEAGGLRVSDVILLKWKNIEGGKVIINSHKTDILTSVWLTRLSSTIVKNYDELIKDQNDYVFPVLDKRKKYNPKELFSQININTVLINKTLNHIRLKAQIKKHLSFHVSRHTFAVRGILKGINIKALQQLMGHSNIGMTAQYLDIANPELDNEMRKFDK